MTAAMVAEIVDTFDALEADESVGAVVITGEPPAFCSGADVAALGTLSGERTEGGRRSITSIYDGFLRVLRSPLPTVAAVNGPAVGAGLNLALACDVRIAGESALFDSRFVHLPIHPGGGHTWMLDRLVGPQTAAAMTLFGHAVDGRRAAEIGLAWSCVPDPELLDAALEFCGGIAGAPTVLLHDVKDTLRLVPAFDDHGAACDVELVRQLASVARPEFGLRFGSDR